MRRIPIAAARRNLADLVARSAKGERIKLTRYDQSLAVLIPKNDLTELERCQEQAAKEQAARESGSRPKSGRRRRRKGP